MVFCLYIPYLILFGYPHMVQNLVFVRVDHLFNRSDLISKVLKPMGMELAITLWIQAPFQEILGVYPLVNVYTTMENCHFNGTIHNKWPCSMIMFNYQRRTYMISRVICTFSDSGHGMEMMGWDHSGRKGMTYRIAAMGME